METIYSQKVNELLQTKYKNSYQIERAISAKRYIDKHYAENFNLDMVAGGVHSSKYHLNREFKRFYGITPLQYLKEKRIQEAKKILANNGTVSDACFLVGYESLSTFSMLFRRMTGKNAETFKIARMNK